MTDGEDTAAGSRHVQPPIFVHVCTASGGCTSASCLPICCACATAARAKRTLNDFMLGFCVAVSDVL